jgi:virginiamycin B lyase
MITIEAKSADRRRRPTSRPARSTRRIAPTVEGLEARGLLSVSIAQFNVQSNGGGPEALAIGPDGDLWYILGGGSQLGKFNPTTHSSSVLTTPVGTGEMGGLVAGPDGKVYALSYGDELLQIDPTTGAMAEFPATNPSGTYGSLAVGPDGNLWYAEHNSQAGGFNIGEFNLTTHQTTEYPISTAAASGGAMAITVGPDGALWFTVSGAGGSQIGRLDPTTGKSTEYPVPTPNSGLYEIVTGPDRNLWFTDYDAGQIDEINPTTHAIAEYPIPTQGSYPSSLTVGPDSNIWFTEEATDKIGMLDPNTHVITEYATGPGSIPEQITKDADGNLWVAEAGVSEVGEVTGITTVTPTPTPTPTVAAVGTQTRLVVTPDPSTPGTPVVLTATVATDNGSAMPGGEVVFTIDGAARPPVPLAMVDGVEQASLTVPSLADGSHTVVATYVGVGGFTASGATGTVMVGTPPTVVSVRRVPPGRRRGLVLGFSDALDPARAQDLQDYRIVLRNGRHLVLRSAVYDPTARTVTLRATRRIRMVRTYRVTVVGTGPAGVADTVGIPLDGDGQPGSNYTTTVFRRTRVFTHK